MGKQNVTAACQVDKLQFKFFQALHHLNVEETLKC